MRKLLTLLCLATLAFAGCGDSDDGKNDGDAAGATDTDFSGEGSDDFCDLARQYEKDFDDTGDTQQAADVEKEYKELAAAVDKLVDEAPSEIRGDVAAVNGAFEQLNELLEKYDYDFTKIPQDEAEKANLDDPEIEAASNRVESYFEKVCKIDSDDDGDTDGVIDDGGTSGEEQAPAETTPTTAAG